MTEGQFATVFEKLTGNAPFPWQWELYKRFANNNVPKRCDIPTGLGKTSVIAVWLIALAYHPDKMPRRLVYVVNRRTVVDQTTVEAARLRKNISEAGLHEKLAALCASGTDVPLALSTLRGQFADNREWSTDPARPAVISGTVDMIGSRLLFNGYGVGFKGKPLQAGFLGQDALLVHDEAHLEPAFQVLIESIEQEQIKEELRECARVGKLPWPKLRVMALTATARVADCNGEGVFELTPAEKNPENMPPAAAKRQPLYLAWRRLTARKHLSLTRVEDEKRVTGKIAEIAAAYKDANAAVLVFARSVEAVLSIKRELDKTRRQVVTLTGTMRGKERDGLVDQPAFRRFRKGAERGETVYLLCTSAGEVGIDISADHMVCDLSTFDSMAQRLGRVHRYGEPTTHVARIDVAHPDSFGKIDKKNGELMADALDKRRGKTLELLRKLPDTGLRNESGELVYDASPKALTELRARPDLSCKIDEAFAPPPVILPATDMLFDSWALTTFRGDLPGRPRVEPYLHGLPEREPPETYVAWREEVQLLGKAGFSDTELGELLGDYPLKPHELLRDTSDRVLKHLNALADQHGQQSVWLIGDRGEVETARLDELVANKERINWMTVVLPPSIGGLDPAGTLGHGAPRDQLDVADEWYEDDEQTSNPRRRVRVWEGDPHFDQKTDGMRLIRTVSISSNDGEELENESLPRWHWYVRPRWADDDGSKTSVDAVSWDDHTNQVTSNAENIARALRLPEDLQRAIRVAARFHDLGKKRVLWQRSIGNPEPQNWLAKSGIDKSGKCMRPIDSTDYRHEFGSLLDLHALPEVLHDEEFKALNDQMRDVVLHLVAAHHGRARPHFPVEEILDEDPKGQDISAIAMEVPRRFARLQRTYGRWGLAYLESILRAADHAASAALAKTAENDK